MASALKDSFVMMVGVSTFLIGATFVVNSAINPVKELKIGGVIVGSLLIFMGIRILYGTVIGKILPHTQGRRGRY